MIVDDDEAVCSILADLCREQEMLAVVFTSPLHALSYLRENPGGTVVSDVMMAELNGFSFTRTIVERKLAEHVLLISAGALPQDKAVAERHGALDLLEKDYALIISKLKELHGH